CLGENNAKRNTSFSEVLHELHVYRLCFMPAVYQHKSTKHLFPLFKISRDKFLECLFYRFGYLGVTVSGKIYKMPGIIDQKMVYQLSFSRLARGFGKVFPAG